MRERLAISPGYRAKRKMTPDASDKSLMQYTWLQTKNNTKCLFKNSTSATETRSTSERKCLGKTDMGNLIQRLRKSQGEGSE